MSWRTITLFVKTTPHL
ncbi:hypothetical protein E2C01_045872 [Portunus trituberculatus]|uniref:Uncharacterized protein n=1 Tax=Portunus trituberculatus TaxID=210409 RepID=A0A5B7G445_PORTR|nr:hypothetical protein [Portunus trituberculatus]